MQTLHDFDLPNPLFYRTNAFQNEPKRNQNISFEIFPNVIVESNKCFKEFCIWIVGARTTKNRFSC